MKELLQPGIVLTETQVEELRLGDVFAVSLSLEKICVGGSYCTCGS